MTSRSTRFEGPLSVNATGSNQVAGTGDQFNVAAGSGTGSRQYQNVNLYEGSSALRFISEINGSQILGWDGVFGTNSLTYRFYINFFADTAANGAVIFQGRSASSAVGNVQMFTGYSVGVYQVGGAPLGTYTVTPNKWYRIEGRFVVGTATAAPYDGIYQWAIYDADGDTPLYSINNTTANLGTAPPVSARFGKTGTVGSVDMAFDALDVDDSRTSFIGKISASSSNLAPTATINSSSTAIASGQTVTLTLSGSDPDGTIASGSVRQIDIGNGAPTVTLNGTGATRTFVTPSTTNGTTLRFGYIVTDNQGIASPEATIDISVYGQTTSIRKDANFEGQIDAIITANNQTAGSGDPLTVANASGTATKTYAAFPLYGNTSAKVVADNASAVILGWENVFNGRSLSVRFFAYFNNVPTEDGCNIWQGRTATAIFGAIRYDTGQTLKFTPTSGSAIGSTPIQTGKWYMVQALMVPGDSTTNGRVKFEVYDASTHALINSADVSNVALTPSAVITHSRVGKTGLPGAIDAYFDGFTTIDNIQSMIGFPDVTSSPPSASIQSSKTLAVEPGEIITLTLTDSDPDGTVVTRTVRQTLGTTVTLNSPSSSTRTFEAPYTLDGTKLRFGYTAVDNSGNSSTEAFVDVEILRAVTRVLKADGTFAAVKTLKFT